MLTAFGGAFLWPETITMTAGQEKDKLVQKQRSMRSASERETHPPAHQRV
jgi:hypothetical protein